MRVLFVTREYPPFEVGGIARHVFYLVKYMKKLGVSCQVISFGDSKYSSEDITFINPHSSIINKSNNPLILDVKIPSDIVRFSRITNSLIKKKRFDIVHIEEPFVGAFIKHEKKVTTIHSTSYGEIKLLLGHLKNLSNFKRLVFYFLMGLYFETMSIASSRVIIVPSSHIGKELSRVYRVPEEKVKVILNGVELPNLPRSTDKIAAKQKLGISPEKALIFTVARHVARKRLETLVEAISLLHRDGSDDYHAVIAGDGPLRPYVKSLIERRQLEHLIEVPGWVSQEKLGLYHQATDIFVLTSEYEAGPLSLLEAMSYGTAVVSSKIDGFPSLLHEGIDGLLFQAGDYYALSGCIRRLLDDRQRLSRMSASARLFAERFDWKIVAGETVDLYRSLV